MRGCLASIIRKSAGSLITVFPEDMSPRYLTMASPGLYFPNILSHLSGSCRSLHLQGFISLLFLLMWSLLQVQT